MALIRCKGCNSEISKQAAACPQCGHPNPVSKHLGGGETILALALAAGAIWWFAGRDGSGYETSSPKQEALAALSLSDVNWTRGGFETVMLLDVSISNSGLRDVKDIVIRCNHTSQSGTDIDSNSATIYQVFPAGKTVSLSKFEMGFMHSQVARSSCKIEDAVLM